MERYDLMGDYYAEMQEMHGGEYYRAAEVNKLIREILKSNVFMEQSYVHVQIPRELWDEMKAMVGGT